MQWTPLRWGTREAVVRNYMPGMHRLLLFPAHNYKFIVSSCMCSTLSETIDLDLLLNLF